MNLERALATAAAALAGFATARLWLGYAIAAAPERLVRTNVSGRRVPAVLGLPLVMGAFVGLGLAYLLERATALNVTSTRAALAFAIVVGVAALAGHADDRRGDEAARGFAGHLGAAARGKVTGGLLKIVGVGIAGLAGGMVLGGGWFALECAALVGLGANLLNLLDRAPGRADKAALVAGLPLAVFGDATWTAAAGGLFGALVACMGADLRERAMLGDGGANPIGAAVGLGVAVSLDRTGRLIALVLLIAANLASERWSFSRGIERSVWLRALDRLGRREEPDGRDGAPLE